MPPPPPNVLNVFNIKLPVIVSFMHILYLFAEMDKKHEKRQVPPALQKLLKADVYMTNLLCTMMNKFLPFRSLKVHYKLLEVSSRNRDVEVDVLFLSAMLFFGSSYIGQ